MSTRYTTKTVVHTITSGPNSAPASFQGWFIDGTDSTETINCAPTSSLTVVDSIGQCCSIGATSCDELAVACDGNSRVANNGDVIQDCGAESCITISIFKQSPLPSPAPPITSQIICADENAPSPWSAHSIYRTLLVSSTGTITVPLTAVSQSKQTTSGDSSNGNNNSSQAWIAGAVVGPLAAIAIFALCIWMLFYRKRRQRTDNGVTPGDAKYSPVQGNSREDYKSYNWTQPYEMDASVTRTEMDASVASREMDATPSSKNLSQPHELSGSN